VCVFFIIKDLVVDATNVHAFDYLNWYIIIPQLYVFFLIQILHM